MWCPGSDNMFCDRMTYRVHLWCGLIVQCVDFSLWGITCYVSADRPLNPPRSTLPKGGPGFSSHRGCPRPPEGSPTRAVVPGRVLGGGSLMSGMVVVAERPASDKVSKGDHLAAAR